MSDHKFRGSNGQERVASRATGASSGIGTDALRPLAAPDVYEAVVRYLIATGWRREELGSGWWWKKSAATDLSTENALAEQLESDGIDLRTMLPDEPQEFWG